ncbi:S-adenosyl-L-methionine-dependent methyltransferase [Trametes elegans]|nr:S-adenosyl-L-methionine-dependent methyltransferase [Trametes elegans]
MSTPAELNTLTARWYDENPGLEDDRLRLHRMEFEVTLRTILASLAPGRTDLKILDIGGGTGPYAFALAARGHAVTLVDISPGLLSLAHARAASTPPAERPTRILEGDATALSSVLPRAERGTFDAVLLLGPLYHLTAPELRERAVREAWGMVRPAAAGGQGGAGAAGRTGGGGGGTLFCAWVSRWAHYRDVATREPARLARKRAFYAKHAEDGEYIRHDERGRAYHAMHHELPSEMPLVLKRVTGEDDVRMVGAEGLLAGGLDRLVNDLQGEEFEAWVEKCLEVGSDAHGWMLSDHIVGIVSKNASAL